MKAILVESFGGAEKLTIREREKPQPQTKEILVKVAATALNRADILQREGKYPPPAGASPILGLEIAGEVVETGKETTLWKKGDKVFGLVPGGAYAQYAVIHEEMAIALPDKLQLTEAAAIPEAFLTAFQALIWLANLQKGESVLIHAGASGVGTAAIQIAKDLGAEVFVTASANKHPFCLDLGASKAIDYKSEKFEEKIKEYTQAKGLDVILDFMAAAYFQQNLDCLQTDGRLILLGAMGGINVENLNLAKILLKRLQIIGSTLRSRSPDYQIKLNKAFTNYAFPKLKNGILKPVVDTVFNWYQVAEAHQYMEANKNTGKIVLKID